MLPRALRNALELQGISKLVAFANGGPSGGLAFYKLDDYNALAKQNQSSDPMDARSRLFALAIASTAQTVSIDSNGRMLLPPTLRNLLQLGRELYIFTAGSWFEVWSRPRWEQQGYPQAAMLWDELFGFASLKPVLPAAGIQPEEGE